MKKLCCTRCGRKLKAMEPLWRVRKRNRFGQGSTMVPFCEKCMSDWDGDGDKCSTVPCANCGRAVTNTERRYRLWSFCSEACQMRHQSTHQAAIGRERRAAARGATMVCKQCGEHFEPVRADSLFCSGACRQKSYRERAKSAAVHRIC